MNCLDYSFGQLLLMRLLLPEPFLIACKKEDGRLVSIHCFPTRIFGLTSRFLSTKSDLDLHPDSKYSVFLVFSLCLARLLADRHASVPLHGLV